MKEEARQQIRRVLVESALLEDAATVGDDENLFHAGLSSLTMVRLLLELEATYGVEFPDETMTRERLHSIDAIAEIVASLVALEP